MSKIEISGLLKKYGEKTVVNIERMDICQGEMVGLVGNNGAGKTTLFRLMLDLLKPEAGRVLQGGVDVRASEDWKTATGEYIDDGFLIDYLTPEEYFYFIGGVYGLTKAQVDERLAGFAHFMNGEILGQQKYIRNFSAGNKQKIGIVSAMLHTPEVLVLDEPFNFLDPTSQLVLMRLLSDFHKVHGATVIVSSHNLNHTVDICQRIVLMEHGCVIRDIANVDGSAASELEAYFMQSYSD